MSKRPVHIGKDYDIAEIYSKRFGKEWAKNFRERNPTKPETPKKPKLSEADRAIIKFLTKLQVATLRGVAIGRPVRVENFVEEFKKIGGKYVNSNGLWDKTDVAGSDVRDVRPNDERANESKGETNESSRRS